jgi:hypothetical protein
MSLSSIEGVKVLQQEPGSFLAGNHEVTLDVSSLNSGIYFLSMVVSETRIVRKLIVR